MRNKVALYILFNLLIPATSLAEDVTITTYYPSPAGIFKTLSSTSGTTLATGATSADRVGIGTTAMANKLDVEGAVAIGTTYSGTSVAPANGLIVEGNVGIGTSNPSYKLDTAGEIRALVSGGGNAEVLRLSNGTSDWRVNVQGGIAGSFWLNGPSGSYGYSIYPTEGGRHGMGIYPSSANARLHVHSDASGPSNVFSLSTGDVVNPTMLMVMQRAGNMGIGMSAPAAKLSVSSTTSDLSGTAMSSTFRVNAGTLGSTAGNELSLGSIGFTSSNQSALGIRAYRAAGGSDWTTTAIGLGMDVDNTIRAGANLWLHANSNIGIGTASPGQKLSVAGTIESTSGGFKLPAGGTLKQVYDSGWFAVTQGQTYAKAHGLGTDKMIATLYWAPSSSGMGMSQSGVDNSPNEATAGCQIYSISSTHIHVRTGAHFCYFGFASNGLPDRQANGYCRVICLAIG